MTYRIFIDGAAGTTGGDVVATDVNPHAIKRAIDELGVRVLADDEDLFSLDGVDIIAPCALGAVLGEDHIDHIKAPMICGTANNILMGIAQLLSGSLRRTTHEFTEKMLSLC